MKNKVVAMDVSVLQFYRDGSDSNIIVGNKINLVQLERCFNKYTSDIDSIFMKKTKELLNLDRRKLTQIVNEMRPKIVANFFVGLHNAMLLEQNPERAEMIRECRKELYLSLIQNDVKYQRTKVEIISKMMHRNCLGLLLGEFSNDFAAKILSQINLSVYSTLLLLHGYEEDGKADKIVSCMETLNIKLAKELRTPMHPIGGGEYIEGIKRIAK